MLVSLVEKHNVRRFQDFARKVLETENVLSMHNGICRQIYHGKQLPAGWITTRYLLGMVWNRYCDSHPSHGLMKIDRVLADEVCEKMEEEFERLHPLPATIPQENENVIKTPQSHKPEDITCKTNSKTENFSLLLAIAGSLIVSIIGLFGALEKGEGRGFFINTIVTIGMFITCTALLFMFFQAVLEGIVWGYTRIRTFAYGCKTKVEAQIVKRLLKEQKRKPQTVLFETSGGKVHIYIKPILIALAIIIGLILAYKLFFSSPYTQIVGRGGVIYRLNKRTGETKMIYGNRMIDVEDVQR